MINQSMKLFNKFVTALGMAAMFTGVSAQNAQSGYFLDDYTYRYEMNPAFANSRSFVSMPALGNMNVDLSGSLHLKNVLFNSNGRTVTFLHPTISASEVLDGLKDMNRLNVSQKINIMSVGFKGIGGYNTITLSERSDIGLRLPKSIFSFLKSGIANESYHIDGMGAFANAYGELALNHSRNLIPGLRVGASVKFLLGVGNVSAKFNNATLELGQDDWSIVTNAEIEARIKNFKYKTKYSEDTKRDYVNDVDIDGFGINGFGVAFDLGAVYTLPMLPDLTVSAAILDLGFINWSNNVLASTNGNRKFNTDRYTFSADDKAENSFKNEGDRLKSDIMTLYQLDNMGDMGSTTTALGSTLNIGAEYKLPMYNKLSFGLLNTTRIQKNYGWTNFRLSANIAPCKVFDASINGALGTFGASFGWLANLHCSGFNLFLGMDHTPTKLAKQGVPLSSNMQFNFGMNFPF